MSPKYFPPMLVRAANGLLRRKVMFGSDYPVITPERWLADFEALDIKAEVRPLVLRTTQRACSGWPADQSRDAGTGGRSEP